MKSSIPLPCRVTVKGTPQGIARILLTEGEGLIWEGALTHREAVERWLSEYAQKRQPSEPLPLLYNTSPFASRVLKTLALLPFGQTTTYGKLAEASGFPTASRAVGRVMNANPFPLIIPCHRVLSATGLGGFALGPEMKEALLGHEGAIIPLASTALSHRG
ncbi:MAG: methylated-DNA--[protein]-cysteine S-methyltransferase [Parachlamydiales bacterium]